MVLAGATQSDQLRGHGIEGVERRDGPDEPVEGATVRGRLHVAGWGRIVAGDLTPTVYIDGFARRPVATRRVTRGDVCTALPVFPDCTTAGYETSFDFEPGDDGRHDLVVVFRAPDGRLRRYAAQSFSWERD